MNVKTWQQRLDAMDTSKGVSNVMRQNCMKAEILALRAALRKETARAERNRESSKKWRAYATRYQQLAAKARP